MARPLRILFEGAWYHVMNRGAGRRAIVPTDEHRETFLALLGEMAGTFGVEVHTYCLMPTHYHLLLHTPRGHLSDALRHLNGIYTQRHNRQRRTDGPLFRGRFKAILVDADSYLAQLSRYIHLNPVLAKIPEHALDTQWSSYPAYLGRVTPPAWLHLQPTLELFGPRDARRAYRTFVERGLDDELRAFYAGKRVAPGLGGQEFRKRIGRFLTGKPTAQDVPERKRVVPRPTIARIVQVTAAYCGVQPDALCRDGRGRGNLPRALAMTLSRSPAGIPSGRLRECLAWGRLRVFR